MRECDFVDDGGGRVDGRVFWEREERLNVVVLRFEHGVGPGEDGGEGAVVGVWSVEGGIVEADEEGKG